MLDLKQFKNTINIEILPNGRTDDLYESLNELDNLIRLLDDPISLNGWSPVGMVKKILNTTSNVFRNISYSILRFNKDLTQSEFMLFYNNNKSKVRIIINLPYSNFAGSFIFIPIGLTTTYEKLIGDIALNYNVMTIYETSNNAVRLFNAIFNELSDENVASVLTTAIQTSIENRVTSSSKLVKTNFEKSVNDRVKFEKVFPTNSSLKNVVGGLGALETNLLNVSNVYKNMKECETVCDKIIAGLSTSDVPLSNNSLKVLSKYVRNAAMLFENYTLTLTAHQVVEHNIVFVINELGTKHKVF